jgi:hypothetical protein
MIEEFEEEDIDYEELEEQVLDDEFYERGIV